MSARTVSCRVFAVLFNEVDRRGAPAARLVEGTGVPEETLRDPAAWVDWYVCHRVFANAGRIWTDRELIGLGVLLPISVLARVFTLTTPLLKSAPDLYAWITNPEYGPSRTTVTCSRYTYRELDDRTLELTFRLDEGLPASREYALVAAGAMQASPRLLGQDDSRIEIEHRKDGHRFIVHLPGRARWWRRLGSRLRWLRESRGIARELRDAYQSLHRSHLALQEEIAQRTHMEEEVRERDNWLRVLLSNAPVAIFAVDQDGNVVRSEGKALRALGLKDGERVGQNIFEIYRDHPSIPEATRRAISGERFATHVEVEGAAYDAWIATHTDEDGYPDGAMGIVVDRTEIRDAEAALADTEENYEQLLDQAQNGVVIVGEDGRFVRTNESFQRMLGYSATELAGLDVQAVTHPGDATITDGVLSSPVSFESIRKRYVRKDGEIVWAETSTIAMGSSKGERRRIAIVRDVSRARETERRLQRSEAMLRAAFDAAPYEIWAMDTEHRYTMQNSLSRQISGDLIGKTVEALDLPEPTLDTFRHDEERALRGETVTGEYQRAVDGTVREFADILSPIWVGEEIQGLVGICLDITDRRREERQRDELQREVRRKDRMQSLGTLAGGIAHDFNNVLTAILGNAQLVTRKVPGDDGSQRNLQEIVTAGKRARDLVDQILAFSRSEPGYREPIRIQPVVEEALQFLRATLPKNVDLWDRLEAPDAVVEGNATQIYQVAVNLAANARHALRENGGVLEISLEPVRVDETLAAGALDLHEGDYVRLTVRDSGPGIPEAVVERIFDPFFTTKEVGEGSGLGLSVVHSVMRDHEGAVQVKTATDVGTSIAAFFPRSGREPSSGPARVREILHGEGRVLLVDDEPPVIRSTSEMLETLGYDVTSSMSGESALRELEEDPDAFDVIITDALMPGMSGTELAERIRGFRPGLPVVLCSGTNPGRPSAGSPFQAFLSKPVLLEDLGLCLRDVLTGSAGKA